MAAESKYRSVLQTVEATEREASYAFQRVSSVVESRATELRKLEDQCAALENLLIFEARRRVECVIAGDVRCAVASTEYQRVLRARRDQMKTQLGERERDLTLATERMQLAQDELRSALIERKRIEVLIAQRSVAERAVQSARDEVTDEEIAQAMRGRRDA